MKTALLERKKDITKVRRIDGVILSPINEYIFGQTCIFNPPAKRISFPVCGFSIKYDGPYRDIFGFDIYSPGGKKFAFGDRHSQKKDPDKNRVGFALDKEKMLQGLLEEVPAAGVDIFPDTNVTGVEKKGERVVVTGNGESFEGAFVIAADGVNSRVARLMGMNKERTFYATRVDFTYFFEDIEIPHIEGLVFIFTMDGTFYITSGCYKNHYHVGISSYNPKDDLRSKLNKFVFEDKIYSHWFKGIKKGGEGSCVLSMLSPIQYPFKDNVLFIGDAAWLVEIANAAAICCGWKAAHAITLALLDGKINKEGVSSYLEWWEQYFYGPYGQLEFKPIELQEFLSADDIDYLAGLIKEPFPHTLNFYNLLNTIGNTYGALFPVIQEERPDVFAKLMGILEKMDDAEAAARKAGFPNK